MKIKITSIDGTVHYIDIGNLPIVYITATTISFCTIETAGSQLTYTRGTDLTAANFDALKDWLNANISYNYSI